MRRRELITLLSGAAAALPLIARAQQAGKVWRIGMLDPRELNTANVIAFQKGLRQFGFVEPENLVIEYRSAEGQYERLSDLVSELLRLHVDVIVVRGTAEVVAVKNAASTTPVVISAVADPVGSGIVASLAQPGGNITGLSSLTYNLEMKRFQFLKELLPGVKRVGSLQDPSGARLQDPNRPLAYFPCAEEKNANDLLFTRWHRPMTAGFLLGLRESGYVEGESVAIECRWAETRGDRLPATVADLIRRQVVVIAATSTPAALAAKAATASIPIVFETGYDPIMLGLVSNLSRPDGNITGVTSQSSGVLIKKRLEILHQLLPKARVMALLVNPSNPTIAEIDTTEARSAANTGRILSGEKPGELPVQQGTKFEMFLNLKTAKALGIEVPALLLARADEVIE